MLIISLAWLPYVFNKQCVCTLLHQKTTRPPVLHNKEHAKNIKCSAGCLFRDRVLLMSFGKAQNYIEKEIVSHFSFFFFFYNYSPSYICGTQQEIETNIKSGIWRNKLGQGGGKRKMFIHIWPIVELEYKYSFIALICICLNLIQYGSSHFTVYQTAWALTAMLTKNVLPLVKHMLTLFQFYFKGCITHKMVGEKRQFF